LKRNYETRALCGNDGFTTTMDGPKTYLSKVVDILVEFDVNDATTF